MHPSRHQIILTFVATFGLTALAGCASGGGGGERGPRRDPNLITAEELAPHAALNCREAIDRLRPRWLRGRGGATNPIVIQDGNRMGQASTVLEGIRAADVESLKFLSPADATMRYGTGVTDGGVIEVVTRKR